ncbi:hypothetical protein BU25DRAFT_97678 [Macroventuria anomochaeta]|uniref:Uncharacterized protein n=1 Tax=Macroventuria anomochaeta TaxID=301207 RepID=A0ACB6RWQ1_9PLEO|nr:uncharacterized protein BU25DRAFT_97678 [Macroventuria anomochaeta]KAF2626400.1 hypothetical protein BU25DRAFT_97678 [Macroventuria anomochaeta]
MQGVHYRSTRPSQTFPIHMSPLQRLHIDIVQHTHVQRLDSLIEARLDTLGHQTGSAVIAEVVLHSAFAECIFLLHVSILMPTIPSSTLFLVAAANSSQQSSDDHSILPTNIALEKGSR